MGKESVIAITRQNRSAIVQRTVRELAIVLGIAVILAAAVWGLRPDRLPLRANAEFYEQDLEAPLVTIDEALVRYDEGRYLFVDTREPDQTTEGYIPGAFAIRADTFDDDLYDNQDFLDPGEHFILYGRGNLLPVSAVAARLIDRGYENLAILQGGLAAWRSAGGPVTAPREQRDE